MVGNIHSFLFPNSHKLPLATDINLRTCELTLYSSYNFLLQTGDQMQHLPL